MNFEAVWRIVGVVVERRELTSAKNNTWRGYVCKVASLGATFDIDINAEQFKAIGDGENVVFSGRFETRQNMLRLILQKFDRPAEPKAVRA